MEKKENKTMKKVLTISALALLLGLVGYTGGSTFAKYITEESVDAGSATVAQWGYTVSATAKDVWGKEYDKTGAMSTVVAENQGVTVVAENNAVAPGTTGSANLKINGQAEVLSQITVTADFDDIILKSGDPASEVYRPITWSVSGTYKINDAPQTIDPITNAESVETFLKSLSAKNIVPGTKYEIDLTITWSWAFHTSEQNDTYDTYLGLLAANKTVENYTADLTTKLEFGVSVVQLEDEVQP